MYNFFIGNLHDQKERGLDKSCRRLPISQENIDKIYFTPHYTNDPRCLQHKIYFDIAFFMGKHGQEGLRQLKKDSFELKITDTGREYLELKYNESTKKSPGDDYNEINEQAILLSQPQNPKCPVNSFKLYLTKLTDLPDLFQTPNSKYKKPTDNWYKSSPVGENTIGKFLKQISENAGLSVIYTNHSIRGTTATAMHKLGYSLHDISQVTKHKNIESLKCYLDKPNLDDFEKYSTSLFKYASKENEIPNSNEEFEEPLKPTRRMYDVKTKKTKTSKVESVGNEIEPLEPINKNSVVTPTMTSSTLTSNVMQMYR